MKWFWSRSGLTFCQAWSGSKLFAKVISRWQVTTSGKRVKWWSWEAKYESDLNLHLLPYCVEERSGRVYDLRSRGPWFESHWRHCVVLTLLSTGSAPEMTQHDWKIVFYFDIKLVYCVCGNWRLLRLHRAPLFLAITGHLRELSGLGVECLTQDRGACVGASPASLHFVLEQEA